VVLCAILMWSAHLRGTVYRRVRRTHRQRRPSPLEADVNEVIPVVRNSHRAATGGRV